MPITGVFTAAAAARSSSSRRRRGRLVLDRGEELRQRPPRRRLAAADRRQRRRRVRRQVDVAAHHHLADHPGQAHALAVLGAVDPLDAVGLQLGDLARHDHAAAAAEDAHVRAAALAQQVDHVLEVLDVAALVGADGDALHVFLQRRGHDLVDRAVVPEVHHLAPMPWRMRRMMLIAASWPSKRAAAVTKRTLCAGR
jgi:hypothetical protein